MKPNWSRYATRVLPPAGKCAKAFPGARGDRRCRGIDLLTRHRRRRRGHAGLDALRTGQRRRWRTASTCSSRSRSPATSAQAEELIELAAQKESEDHGGPHLLFTGAVTQDQAADRRRRAGQAVLLRFHAREPGPVPARCQRDLGSGAARSVDHGPPDQGRRPKRSSRPVRSI